MPSAPYPVGEKIRNTFSVICGVLLFFGLLFAVFPLFNDVYERLSSTTNSVERTATLVSGIYIGIFFLILLLSGLLTGLIAKRRKILHAFFTGCVLVVLYMLAIGKDINWESVKTSNTALVQNISVPVLLLVGPVVGGWVAGKVKSGKAKPKSKE